MIAPPPFPCIAELRPLNSASEPLSSYHWPAYTQYNEAKLVAGVCRRLSASVTLHGGPAGGFTRAG